MERECSQDDYACSWRDATVKRRAWAQSRESWQAPECQDRNVEREPLAEPMEEKPSIAEDPGRVPSKIASWLKECRTPQGASLDEQGLPTRGTLKNGCSFEDDLSLGAEANLLQHSGTKGELSSNFDAAKEQKRSFLHRGLSITSSGSGRSSATVSSVSELLDLCEEDPEETLYNLGFGTEEPDISTKIPSRFFNGSSSARGIDIKVYLAAQLQRMELENPNSALTSRFRQIEVLTTVANAFNSLYSQVSGQPVQMIGTIEAEPADVSTEKKSSQARNVAKIIKKTLTKHNLLNLGLGDLALTSSEQGDKGDVSHAEAEEKNELKQQKAFRKKESPWLATVAEETNVGPVRGDANLANGNLESKETHFTPQGSLSREGTLWREEGKASATTIPDKEPSGQRVNPLVAHLLTQPKDSFEMEEVQSIEGDPSSGTRRIGFEHPLRMASQQSDSSGFADDPSPDGSISFLKVQESSDSCDSENTVKSSSFEPSIPLDHPVFEKFLQGSELLTVVTGVDSSNMGMRIEPGGGEEVPSGFPVLSKPTAENGPPAEPTGVSTAETGPTAEPISASTAEIGTTAESTYGPTREIISTTIAEPTGVPTGVERGLAEDPIGILTTESVGVPNTEHVPAAEPGSSIGPISATEHGPSIADSMVDGPPPLADGDTHQKASSVYKATLTTGGRLVGQQRFPLRRSRSLPTSLLSPACVVSTIKIQIQPGGLKRFNPPTFSYRYTPEEEFEEEEEEEAAVSVTDGGDVKWETTSSASMVNSSPNARPQQTDEHLGRMPSHLPRMSPHLRASSCSLHSMPPDWPQRPLADHSQLWSACSVPNLHRTFSPYGWSHGCYTAPSGISCSNLYRGDDLHGPSGIPHYRSHSTLHNDYHRAPYSAPHSVPYYDHFNPPGSAHCCHPFPGGHMAAPPMPSHTPSSTEMQLRRVLHDIRSTVRNLDQCSPLSRSSMPSPAPGTQMSAPPAREATLQEMQGIRRSLNTYRAQMMNLELALVRQQCSVYQDLSEEERQEEMQLQQLRSAVRQELQELELQLEDRLLSLEEQLRCSDIMGLYRHPMGHRMDSLSSISSLTVTGVGSEVTREQLGYGGRHGVSHSDASSRSTSPCQSAPSGGPAWDHRFQSLESSGPPRERVYRASVCITPAPPPRPDVTPSLDAKQPDQSDPRLASAPAGERGGAESANSPQLQQLLQQVRESIAEEVRQQILTELLSAVSPRR
ncbi:LOW QUALITY PROTEIN: protein ITPRID2 [Brienomyrus brachyistius]|uniref:LOW QUALITY PROTEIN: protein ITPRID2 n=1 Tax=Brienomyrus brachyistius TaxID=42636 RepID=UPI0020B34EEF|nr:LOW QUALITY PROTEIN: protein ITPRID2 [Brienomyrus brachyistius]